MSYGYLVTKISIISPSSIWSSFGMRLGNKFTKISISQILLWRPDRGIQILFRCHEWGRRLGPLKGKIVSIVFVFLNTISPTVKKKFLFYLASVTGPEKRYILLIMSQIVVDWRYCLINICILFSNPMNMITLIK